MKKLSLLAFSMVVLFVFTGCASLITAMGVSEVQNALEDGTWGGPENHTVLFGVSGPDACNSSVMLQQNPAHGYNFYSPISLTSTITIGFINVGKERFFFLPLPVGSELKEFSFTTYVGRNVYTYYEGIAGVDIILTKPGLQFYGKDNKKHSQELKALKKMLKYFKGSDWEQVILNRIEEISNDK